ncbi:MAG: response regulator transcription factor [Bacteroidales bacterium]
MEPIDLLLVDDHQLFREGMKLILQKLPYTHSIYEADDGEEAVAFFAEGGRADLVLMDIEMPGLNGVEATAEIVGMRTGCRVIALSMYSDENYYTAMIRAGARGFLLKNSGIREVEEAIRQVLSGNNYFSPEILQGIVRSLNRRAAPDPQDKLTDRETEVLYLVCKGHSNQEIGDILHISKRTVDKHRENLLLKTGSRNTAGSVIYAVKTASLSFDAERTGMRIYT